MSKKLTIAVSDEVYERLQRQIAQGKIGCFIDQVARQHLVERNSSHYWLNASNEELEKDYAEAAADVDREREALEWCEAFIGETLEDEDFSDWPGYPGR